MNIIILNLACKCFPKEIIVLTESIDWTAWIQAVMAVATFVLGVITIFIGKKIITSKREEAKYGFYINMLVLIERYKSFLSENPGLMDHLVKKEIRDKKLKGAMDEDKAKELIPIFTSLCEEFLQFISTSTNNVVPEHWKNSKSSEEEEWQKWYENIKCLVLYSQKCMLLNKNLVPYFTDSQVTQYLEEKTHFENALDYLENELNDAIVFPKKIGKVKKKNDLKSHRD